MLKRLHAAFAVLLLLLANAAAAGQELEGKVLRVKDGDTARILAAGRIYDVRLQYIDAPESDQASGAGAAENLKRLIDGKTVRVRWSEYDRYGRPLGTVFLGEEDVNLRQLRDGYAWHFKKYADRGQARHDYFFYANAEDDARRSRIGLWQDEHPTPPWDFRKNKHAATVAE